MQRRRAVFAAVRSEVAGEHQLPKAKLHVHPPRSLDTIALVPAIHRPRCATSMSGLRP